MRRFSINHFPKAFSIITGNDPKHWRQTLSSKNVGLKYVDLQMKLIKNVAVFFSSDFDTN